MVVRDAHDDPLDDINMSKDADIHERSAPRVDALEREQGVTATATDNRKQRDVVASDIDNGRVVDQRGNPVPDIEHQETPACVNDALWGAAESLVGFYRFECLPEAEAAGGNDEVRLAVEAGNCRYSKLLKGSVSHSGLFTR